MARLQIILENRIELISFHWCSNFSDRIIKEAYATGSCEGNKATHFIMERSNSLVSLTLNQVAKKHDMLQICSREPCQFN